MDDRLNTQQLVEQLVRTSDIDANDAEAFIGALFALIEDALEQERYVKVRGLGTFKLIGVESRQSINVNTGERIEIQGHTKVSFTPDPGLKDLINHPFSHFETVLLNDNIAPEVMPTTEPVEEMSDAEDDFSVVPVVEPEALTPVEPEPAPELRTAESIETIPSTEPITPEEVAAEIPESIEEAPIPAQSEPEVLEEEPTFQAEEATPAEPIVEEEKADKTLPATEEAPSAEPPAQSESPTDASESAPKVVMYSLSAPPFPKEEQQVSTPKKHSKKKLGLILPLIIVALCLGVLAYLYLPSPRGSKSPRERTLPESAQPATLSSPKEVELPRVSVPSTDGNAEKAVDKATLPRRRTALKPIEPDSTSCNIVGTLTIHTVKEGETLVRLALRYYGTKALWPYIAMYNKSVIKNPDLLVAGMELRIPKLEKKDTDGQ